MDSLNKYDIDREVRRLRNFWEEESIWVIPLPRNNYNIDMKSDNMKQKWKKVQAVEITIDEIFCLQDKLDDVKDDPIKVWEVFDDFLAICESQLELSPTFLKQLHEVDIEKDFVPLTIEEIDELFDDYGESCTSIAEDYVNYVLYHKKKEDEKKYDIPFRPRLNF